MLSSDDDLNPQEALEALIEFGWVEFGHSIDLDDLLKELSNTDDPDARPLLEAMAPAIERLIRSGFSAGFKYAWSRL